MPGSRTEEEYAARYAALYKEHNAQLVAYARSLTGSATMAEDLAAEAHFRVWRRIQSGHEIENVAAYLTTTVRNLAAGLGRAQREFARDVAELPEDPAHAAVHAAAIEDPEQRASHVDLITRLLKELPDRWAKALWYAEVEDLPMEAVGEKIGANAGTTAVVLTRARERLRQAFLLSQPGMPLSEECEPYWKHMATIVRGTASAKRTRSVTDHCDECDDCRSRMLLLTETNTRLPALLGPALLAGVLGGGAWFAPAVAGAGAAGAGASAAAGTAARAGSRAGRHARLGLHGRLARHGLTPTKMAVGSVAAVGIAATVATLALGSTGKPNTSAQSALQTPPASSQPTPASASTGTPISAPTSAAASQAAATQAAAAPTTSAATSVAAPLSAPTVAAQVVQSQAPATASAPTTSAATTPVATSASATPTAAPSTSASVIASPIAVDTPTATLTPTPSQSSSPVVTPTFTPTATPTPTPTPTPSQTVTPTPSPSPTCWWYVFEYCDEQTTGNG